jgi:ABC-2 type transport system ATP-binding protein
MNVVELDNVTKTFGRHVAVDRLTAAIPHGTIYGFIGPNGSGKTTTLRMIMRIYHPDAGTGHIRVFGQESFEAVNHRIGYLPEERGLYRKMKIRDLLRFFAELKGKQNAKPCVDEWLGRLDLADWADKKVETLSKGMAQRVQFIAAVIAEPELLILDEPFTGLDPVNADLLREEVLRLRKNGATVVFSTHDMNMAERMCDFILMIHKGRKVLDGTLDSIRDTYGHDTVRVRLDGNGVDLSRVPGVERVTDFGRLQELRIGRTVETQDLLASLMRQGRVTHFELARPSLHDIFVRIAGDGHGEGADA